MKRVLSEVDGMKVNPELLPLGPNGQEARDEHQKSFKVLGLAPLAMSYPRYQSHATIRGASTTIYLWADAAGGSTMELWVMEPF